MTNDVAFNRFWITGPLWHRSRRSIRLTILVWCIQCWFEFEYGKNIKDNQTGPLMVLLWHQKECSTTEMQSCRIIFRPLYWADRDITFSHCWSAAGTDEPPPCWLSVIWQFIKVRRSRHACVYCGFFYFMESLISRGSLTSSQIPVLTNAAGELCTQCAFSSSRPPLNASHDKQEGGPITLPKCVLGGVRHSIIERRAHYRERDTCGQRWAFHCDCRRETTLNITFRDERWSTA